MENNWSRENKSNPKKLLSFWNKKIKLPGMKTSENAVKNLSFTEKFIFQGLSASLIISSIFMLSQVSQAFMVEVPQKGGTLTEGIIGSPRFINPLFAETDADRDLTSLIYSGLLKSSPEGGLINDLSKSYSISDDGLTYTFKLKEDIYFHDGSEVTTEDVEFTVLKAQDPILRSPRRVNWEGVSVEIINEKEISFILSQPYAPFLENTTIGILPKHLWENLEPEQFTASLLNIEPVGSGPYKVKKINRESDGLPSHYQLRSFKKYSLGEPFIKNLYIRMFSNEENLIEAFKRGRIDSLSGISPSEVPALKEEMKGLKVESIVLPRIFGTFFNQNQASIFTNREVRVALNRALDKERFVEEILFGFGSTIESPIPKVFIDNGEKEENISHSEKIKETGEILARNGWEKGGETGTWEKGGEILRFSISTHDTNDLRLAAEILKNQWEELGAEVEINLFNRSDFSQNVIRPRRYEVLLFGKIIGKDLDMSPFWHSSNRNDPGLNVSLYANISADSLLEEIRTISEIDERIEKYKELEEIIKEDVPAVFIYSPDFIYLMPEKIKNIKLGHITTSNDRFINIHEWYIETNNVWWIFNN